MIPNIPDTISKLLAIVGLFLIGYSFYSLEKIDNKYLGLVEKSNGYVDSIEIAKFTLDHELENLKKRSANISKRYDVENPISSDDSTINFSQVLSGSQNEVLASKEIDIHWNKYLANKFKYKLIKKKHDIYSDNLRVEKSLQKSTTILYNSLLFVGALFFLLGFLIWAIEEEKSNNRSLAKQNEKVYPYCQSCGKSFSSVRNYGVNKDSSLNYAFCKECYNDGEFTNPELTKEDFMSLAQQSIKNKKRLTRRKLQTRFEGLERWNKDKY